MNTNHISEKFDLEKGDYFVLNERFWIDKLFQVFSIQKNSAGAILYEVHGGFRWPEYCVRPAEPDEIEFGHRKKDFKKGGVFK
ncbi:hypothetical protein [Acinetobacter sp. A47]|uniref:hypothetical protein n=1 Tax=Acinetobacter sp. A47 TaxID=1561217 RepID=UPI00056E4D3B|nr:hypothetical protein [Acinetobacter sp. A47]